MPRQAHYWRLYEAQARKAEAEDDEGSDHDAVLLASQPQPSAHTGA
jgi:ATP-binding cassette, subfamily B, bacterial